MAARSAVPRRKGIKEAAIQLLSAVLGIVAAVAVAALGVEDAGSVVLVTVVLVVMFVLGDVAVKLQVVGIGPGPVGARYTASRTPAVNQRKEGTFCGLHIASLP